MLAVMHEKITETVEALGGEKIVCERLDVVPATIRQWRFRGWFPGHTYLPISDLADEAGVELDLGLFKFDRKPARRKGNGASQA